MEAMKDVGIKEVMKSEEENRVKLRREKKIRAERTNTMLRLSSNW